MRSLVASILMLALPGPVLAAAPEVDPIDYADLVVMGGRREGVISVADAGPPAAGRLDFRAGAPDALPLTDGAASVALVVDAVDSWGDPAACAAELRRVLGPGGRLFVVADATRCGLGGAPDDPKALKDLLKSAGFRGVERRRYFEGALRMVVLMARRPWS